MYDERDEKWIRIYRTYIIIMFWVYVLAAAVCCICGWCRVFWWTNSFFMDGILCLFGGLITAYAHLVCNMVILNFLANVQAIREKVEKMGVVQQAPKACADSNTSNFVGSTPVFRDDPAVRPAPEGMWVCKNCGTHNSTNYAQCKKCGKFRS